MKATSAIIIITHVIALAFAAAKPPVSTHGSAIEKTELTKASPTATPPLSTDGSTTTTHISTNASTTTTHISTNASTTTTHVSTDGPTATPPVSTNGTYFSLTGLIAMMGFPNGEFVINAYNGALWIDRPTTGHCPPKSADGKGGRKTPCPPSSNITNFVLGPEDKKIPGTYPLEMGASVYGGQRVWVDGETGALRYTAAHDHSLPHNAYFMRYALDGPWLKARPQNLPSKFRDPGQFYACPTYKQPYYLFQPMRVHIAVHGVHKGVDKRCGWLLPKIHARQHGPAQFEYK